MRRLWGGCGLGMLVWSSRRPECTPPPPKERWVRLLLMCRAPLLSGAAGPEPSAQQPEQRDLYAAPSPRARRLPGPVFFSSRAAGIQWAETLPPGPLRRHKRPFSTGAAKLPAGGESWRGRGQGCHKDLIVCWARSAQGLGSRGRANLSRQGSCGERGRGRLRPTGEG